MAGQTTTCLKQRWEGDLSACTLLLRQSVGELVPAALEWFRPSEASGLNAAALAKAVPAIVPQHRLSQNSVATARSRHGPRGVVQGAHVPTSRAELGMGW